MSTGEYFGFYLFFSYLLSYLGDKVEEKSNFKILNVKQENYNFMLLSNWKGQSSHCKLYKALLTVVSIYWVISYERA